jgi:hypothetical protein
MTTQMQTNKKPAAIRNKSNGEIFLRCAMDGIVSLVTTWNQG